jgi:hypothetical protein
MTNRLTENLIAKGYTHENHPDYVRVGGGYDLVFEYTFAHLCRMVWEAPCGLMKKGGHWLVGNCSYLDTTYSAENDNPLGGCPYYDKIPCQHRVAWAVKLNFWGNTCIFREAQRPYDYESSIEKLNAEADKIFRDAWERLRAENPEAAMCHRYCWNNRKQIYEKHYNVDECARMPCQNSICAISRETLNKEQVYIVYDTRKTRLVKVGLFEETEEEILKGSKVFKNSCDRTVAELWLRANAGKIKIRPEVTPDEYRRLHYQSICEQGSLPCQPPAGYDKYKLTVTTENLRIKKKGENGRDLKQDLEDISNGIKVTHLSDQLKQAAAQKRERKKKRQAQKHNKVLRAGKAKALVAIAEKGLEGLDKLEQWTVKEFLTPEEAKEAARPHKSPQQLTLFDEEVA